MSNPFEHKGYKETSPGVLSREMNAAAIRELDPRYEYEHCVYIIHPSTDEKKLNKTERGYLAYLRRLNPPHLGIQRVTLKLGDDCRYTPDFSTINENGRFVFHEVKGFMRDDALVKLKVAARQFPMFDFVLVKKNGVSWDIQPVKP